MAIIIAKNTMGIMCSGSPGMSPTKNNSVTVTAILIKVMSEDADALSVRSLTARVDAVEKIEGRPKKVKNIERKNPHGPMVVNHDKLINDTHPIIAIQNPVLIV